MFKEKTNEPQSMNTQKMSYFSDIDLATLHRTRLNERIQYKLSWFNRRQKYYIPPTAAATATTAAAANQQSYHRDTQKTIGVSQKFGIVEQKKPYKKSNSESTFITQKSPLSAANNKFTTTNRQRKPICISKRSSSALSLNGTSFSTRIANQCDNSKDVNVHIDEITAHKRSNKNNNNILSNVNNRMNDKKRQPLTDKHVSSSSSSSSSNDPDSLKTDANDSDRCGGDGVSDGSGTAVHAKCLSGDAINRNTRMMTDKTGDCHFPSTETSTIVDQALDEDLNLPHRKRSGTWP